jgi:catechol 2,3-dioxygenase-like lactoylglutathione lyase family enzyme
MTRSIVVLLAVYMAGVVTARTIDPAVHQAPADAPVRLGNFSVSLTVKDIHASHLFYEKLGFRVFMGTEAQKLLILQNETSTIGLFQGAFTRNTLTFNPGWNRKAETLPDFDDVRAIQRTLKARGLPFTTEASETTSGPASFGLTDPDGNPILVDQHVAGPKK